MDDKSKRPRCLRRPMRQSPKKAVFLEHKKEIRDALRGGHARKAIYDSLRLGMSYRTFCELVNEFLHFSDGKGRKPKPSKPLAIPTPERQLEERKEDARLNTDTGKSSDGWDDDTLNRVYKDGDI